MHGDKLHSIQQQGMAATYQQAEGDTAEQDKAGESRQQVRKAQQNHRERRQQAPSASCEELHFTYKGFPPSKNIAAHRTSLTQIQIN